MSISRKKISLKCVSAICQRKKIEKFKFRVKKLLKVANLATFRFSTVNDH